MTVMPRSLVDSKISEESAASIIKVVETEAAVSSVRHISTRLHNVMLEKMSDCHLFHIHTLHLPIGIVLFQVWNQIIAIVII
jgi:hypothetical protein